MAIEAPELDEKGERVFDLRFCVEDDIDPIETAREWNSHPGRPSDCLLKQYVYPLVEPHIHAANGRWPPNTLLPAIEPYRKATAGLVTDASPSRSLVVPDSPTSVISLTGLPAGKKSKKKIISPVSAATSPSR